MDIDYGKIKLYVGNYDFWYESSQLVQQLLRNKNKQQRGKDRRAAGSLSSASPPTKPRANRQPPAASLLDKLTVEEMPCSTRRYPFVGFTREREIGKDVLFVTDVCKTVDGVQLLDHVSFIAGRNEKIAFVGENELAQTTMFKILMGELEPDGGSVKWGVSSSQSYFPKDNSRVF